MDVSIIIPTRDSAIDLTRCLSSLRADTASLEVVIVDQQSTDGTQTIAANHGATVLEVSRPVVYTPPTHSRNAGAAVARGEFLLHLDADMELAPATLDVAMRACRQHDHVAVTLEEVDVAVGYWAACKALERSTYRNSALLEGARFVRAETFRSVGGYDENLGSGEDWDIHSRYLEHGTIGRVEGAVLHHLGSVTPRVQLRKKFGYGRSSAEFLGKQEGAAYSAEMMRAYARSWRLFAREPAHALGFVVLRVGEAGALAAGLAAERLRRRRGASAYGS